MNLLIPFTFIPYYFILVIYGTDFIHPWSGNQNSLIKDIIISLYTFFITYIWIIYWCGNKKIKTNWLRFISPICFLIGKLFSLKLSYNEIYFLQYFDNMICGIFF